MTPNQIALVRLQFAQVQRDADAFAADFYARLFEADPSLRPMFRGNMTEQGRKLAGILGVAVAALDDLRPLDAAIARLARRHVGYGVREAHYATVGAALLGALSNALGLAFTPEARAAWAAAYRGISGRMIAASREEDVVSAPRPAAA